MADLTERIEKNKIILYDNCDPKKAVLKEIEIVKPNGEKRKYVLRRTAKGGYLFN